jgi:hypothetical protein
MAAAYAKNYHAHDGSTAAGRARYERYISDCVPMHGLGVELVNIKQYDKALSAVTEALQRKAASYGPRSIFMCITQSELVDCHLSYAQTLGKRGSTAFNAELAKAWSALHTYESIATEVKNAEQLRICRELRAALTRAGGKTVTRSMQKVPSALKTTEAKYSVNAEYNTYHVSPAVKRCYYAACSSSASPDTLKRCSRCLAVYYCNSACQSAAWKAGHKRVCFVPDADKKKKKKKSDDAKKTKTTKTQSKTKAQTKTKQNNNKKQKKT